MLTFVATQPVLLLQLSAVHTLPSSQFNGVVTQAPVLPSQVSTVQALLSSHDLGVNTQPVVEAQESMVQGLPSSHTTWVNAQLPVVGSHTPVAHLVADMHCVGVPDWQAPLWQKSPTVQGLPSSQGPRIGLATHWPVVGSQMSDWHTIVWHVMAEPETHAPPWH